MPTLGKNEPTFMEALGAEMTVSRERDALHALCLQRNEELARVDRELMGIRSQRDAFAVKLAALRQERDAYRQAFADRTQALTESGDKLCRTENERDALRDALRRADNILRGLDATGAYAAGAGEQVAKLLKNIPAPGTVGGLVTLAGKAFPG